MLAAAALLTGLASSASANDLFGRPDTDRRSWFGDSAERLYGTLRARLSETSVAQMLEAPAVQGAIEQAGRLYEDVRARLAETSAAHVLEDPAVQGAIERTEEAMQYLAAKAKQDLIEPIARYWGAWHAADDKSLMAPPTGEVKPEASAAPRTSVTIQDLAAIGFPPDVLQKIAQESVIDEDPFEGMNRMMFRVNNSLRGKVFDPAADYYFKLASPPVQEGVRNFFANLREPTAVASYLIEGRTDLARDATARFGINTVLGVVGVYDPATDMGFPSRPRNLEQTLCASGLPAGPYVVLPILGPATIRDAVARLGTAVAYYNVMGLPIYAPYRVTDIALQYAEIREKLNSATAYSLDPYTTHRILYLTQRALSCGSLPPEEPDVHPK